MRFVGGGSGGGEETSEFQEGDVVGGGRFSLLLEVRAVGSNLSRGMRLRSLPGGEERGGDCAVPCAAVVVGLPSLVDTIGLLSFLEKRDLHGELRSRLSFAGECTAGSDVGSGAGSISLSSQASIFSIFGGDNARSGS